MSEIRERIGELSHEELVTRVMDSLDVIFDWEEEIDSRTFIPSPHEQRNELESVVETISILLLSGSKMFEDINKEV